MSLKITPASVHEDNQFSWGPMQEVAKLFAGIFITILPVIAMLRAGIDGPFGAVIAAVTRPDGTPDPAMYFCRVGFLDNAPTYLVFFNTAGGDPQVLMNQLAPVLAAISAGSVFMGANSYIGNAPNLMVKSIAEDRGVKMPSFFGYMAWSGAILIPLFFIMTFIWFRKHHEQTPHPRRTGPSSRKPSPPRNSLEVEHNQPTPSGQGRPDRPAEGQGRRLHHRHRAHRRRGARGLSGPEDLRQHGGGFNNFDIRR